MYFIQKKSFSSVIPLLAIQFIVTCLNAGHSSAKECGCGKANVFPGNSSASEFPWIVKMKAVLTDSGDGNSEAVCGGVIIDESIVLTDIKCKLAKVATKVKTYFYDEKLISLVHLTSIDIGKSDMTRIGESQVVAIRLPTPLVFSETLRPVCLVDKVSKHPEEIVSKIITEDKEGSNKEPINSYGDSNIKTYSKYKILDTKDRSHLICPGGEEGPIMYEHKDRWFLYSYIAPLNGFTCFTVDGYNDEREENIELNLISKQILKQNIKAVLCRSA